MKRVVITGATSMIGVALIEECIKNGIEVLGIVRKKSSRLIRLPQSSLLELYECNLDNLDSIVDVQGTYDVLYHFAWDHTSKAERDNPIFQERNIKYTLDAVNLAKRLGCKKFVGAGSQAEYGHVDGIIAPDTPVAPFISYGVAKYAAGILSRKLCDSYEMICIWGRIFSVYGRYDNRETMLNYAIDCFMAGEPANFSAATQNWDYLHEKDAGRMFFLIGECAEASKVYCIASGESRPLKEFILDVRDVCSSSSECAFAEEVPVQKLVSLQTTIDDLVNDIGYKPQIAFREGVKDMIQFRICGGGKTDYIAIKSNICGFVVPSCVRERRAAA